MPCWNLLGVEICIPSLDDIVEAVVTPLVDFITNSLNAISSTILAGLTDLGLSLSNVADFIVTSIISFVQDPLGSISLAIDNVLSSITNLAYQFGLAVNEVVEAVGSKIDFLGSQVAAGFSDTHTALIEGFANVGVGFEEIVNGAALGLSDTINTIGTGLHESVVGTQEVMLTAFDGVGEAISNMIGGIFGGFGTINVDEAIGGFSSSEGLFQSILTFFGAAFSPITPDEAWGQVPNYLNQVHAAVTTLHTTNMVIESISAGQIDISLSEAWRYPNTAAALANATTIAGLEVSEGVLPALKRRVLRDFQPYIPPYQDVISIYVKEGYLEDHWVELPAEMVQNFAELGFSEYWTRRLWGKHWVYPSVSQLFEMLHRSQGTQPEINVDSALISNMLKLHDFEPKWRPRLEAISWATWRIFDIRREWELWGDEDLLQKRLIDSGYNPVIDAGHLAEVQKYYVLRTDILRMLTEADQDFIEGWIDEGVLRADYDATPLNPQTVELRIARAKLRRTREVKRDLKAALTDRFIKGDLSSSEYTEELSRLGITEEWINTELARASARKYKRVKEETAIETKALTVAQYGRAFRERTIDETTFRQKLEGFKYDKADIDILVEIYRPEEIEPLEEAS